MVYGLFLTHIGARIRAWDRTEITAVDLLGADASLEGANFSQEGPRD
jgi:hypothetical protein